MAMILLWFFAVIGIAVTGGLVGCVIAYHLQRAFPILRATCGCGRQQSVQGRPHS